MSSRVAVVGVGMIPFATPRKSEQYDVMAEGPRRGRARRRRHRLRAVQQAYAGYVYGDSTCGQAALYGVGLTGIPVFNVNNNCSTGSTALLLARQAIEAARPSACSRSASSRWSAARSVRKWTDRPNPLDQFADVMNEALQGFDDRRRRPRSSSAAPARSTARSTAPERETFAKIAVKARKHAANNPYALFNDPLTVEEVLASPEIFGPLTRLQCCPPTCGAAAAILCSDEFAEANGLDAAS